MCARQHSLRGKSCSGTSLPHKTIFTKHSNVKALPLRTFQYSSPWGPCGAPLNVAPFFNGGNTNTSRPLVAHVAANSFRPRLQARHNRTREVIGSYLPTTMVGIHAAHVDIAAHDAEQPLPDLPHAPAVHFCRHHPRFTRDPLRTSGTQSSSSLPGPVKASIIVESTTLFRLVVTRRGNALKPSGTLA